MVSGLLCPPLTVATDAKYPHPAFAGSEIVLLCQLFLQFFNFWAHDLNNPAAFYADQMTMLLMLVFVLKTPDPISKIDFSCKAGVGYYIHRPIHSSKTNLWSFLSDKLMKVINRQMPLRLQEYIQDLLSLFAVEHPLAFDILPENVLR